MKISEMSEEEKKRVQELNRSRFTKEEWCRDWAGYSLEEFDARLKEMVQRLDVILFSFENGEISIDECIEKCREVKARVASVVLFRYGDAIMSKHQDSVDKMMRNMDGVK